MVKAISDTVEHLVTRPLSARPRNSIWRQANEWSLMEFIFYIFYCCFLTFFFFLVGITYILKCQVSYSLSEKRFYDRIFLKHSLYKDLIH
jgi:magnesium-transporting ATPase (P-type)